MKITPEQTYAAIAATLNTLGLLGIGKVLAVGADAKDRLPWDKVSEKTKTVCTIMAEKLTNATEPA